MGKLYSKDGKFWVAKANSVKSKLFSPSDIQSIMKKAIVERLKGVYGVSWFEEDGASFPIRVAFMKDVPRSVLIPQAYLCIKEDIVK